MVFIHHQFFSLILINPVIKVQSSETNMASEASHDVRADRDPTTYTFYTVIVDEGTGIESEGLQEFNLTSPLDMPHNTRHEAIEYCTLALCSMMCKWHGTFSDAELKCFDRYAFTFGFQGFQRSFSVKFPERFLVLNEQLQKKLTIRRLEAEEQSVARKAKMDYADKHYFCKNHQGHGEEPYIADRYNRLYPCGHCDIKVVRHNRRIAREKEV
jgi:hypothetical protein